MLLLRLPSSAFDAIVPVLIGIGCLLVIVQPWLSRRVAARRERLGIAESAPHGSVWLWLAVLLTGVYGGYFGAAQGVLLIASWASGSPSACRGSTRSRTCSRARQRDRRPRVLIISAGELAGRRGHRGRVGARRPDRRPGRKRLPPTVYRVVIVASASPRSSTWCASRASGWPVGLARLGWPGQRVGLIASASTTRPAGRRRRAGDRDLAAADAAADHDPGPCATRSSTSIGQSAGRPTGVIPPYSMPVWRTASAIGEGDLADVEVLAHGLVHVGPVGGQDHAGRHRRRLAAAPGHDDAVRRDFSGTSYAAQNRACRRAGVDAATKHSSRSSATASATGSRQALEMFTSRLPIQRAKDVHQVRILVRLTVAHSEDARLSDYVRLREASLRRHLESERGLFIAEGEKVIRRAVEAGYRPRSSSARRALARGSSDVVQRWPAVPVFVVTKTFPSRSPASTFTVEPWPSLHPRTTAYRRGPCRDAPAGCPGGHRRPRQCRGDPAQRGRPGLGWARSLAPRAADPLYRRSIKVSMGAVFSLPWARLAGSWRGSTQTLAAAGFHTVAPALAGRRPTSMSWLQHSAAAELAGAAGYRGSAASRSTGRMAPQCAPASRCWPESTPSTWPPRPPSPAMRCLARGVTGQSSG